MSKLPYVSTDECPHCGAETKRNRYQVSLVESPAWTTIHTGNLCQSCYQQVADFLTGGSKDSLE